MSKIPQDAIEALVLAAKNAVTNKQSHYKARNERFVTIEGDDGEHMWLVSLQDMNDIEQALEAAVPPPETNVDPALIGIAEEMKESGGHWQPCSGCYDTEDGYPTQKYDFSPALQTAIGCGCHECGGLGAIWWHMTDAEIASYVEDMEALAGGEA